MQQNRQLFINGISVDFFSDDEVIPLILQVNNLGDLESLQGHGSKMFKLPLTQKNRQALGFPDDITITNNIPYTQSPAKYIESGIEIIANGLAEVQSVQDNFANVMLLFGNIDLLDNLGGQIYDMGDSTSQWSGYGANKVWDQFSIPYPDDISNPANCIWDVSHAAGSQNKTDGWIWPVVNYGDINTTPPFNGPINVRNLRPGFFLHSAIELLIQSAGYTIDKNNSCLYNDPVFANLYQKLIIQFDNGSFEHGTDWQNTPDNLGTTLTKGTDQVINSDRYPARITTDIYTDGNPESGVVKFGPSDCFTAPGTAISGEITSFTGTFHFNVYIRTRYTGEVGFCKFQFTLVDINGMITDLPSSITIQLNPSYHKLGGEGNGLYGEQTFLNQKLTQDFELVAGQKIYVRYTFNDVGLLSDNLANTYVIVRAGATFSVVTNEQLVTWGQPIQCERILPQVAQLDLLKDTLQHFGMILISDPNTATVKFTSFKKIVANKAIARDWSDKCLDMGKQVSFQLGDYHQVNWLRYQQDSAIPLTYMPNYFADDSIAINDKTLNPTVPVDNLFQSIFGPSLNAPYLGGTIAQISDPTSTELFSVGNQPRLLIDQKLSLLNAGANGGSVSVNFTDNDSGQPITQSVAVNDVISVPYFFKTDAPDLGGGAPRHLCWCDKGGLPGLKTTYYPEFANILNQSKAVTRYFYLTPLDICDFDFTIPVYLRQDGCYYYVSKIDSWVNGQPTKVDLIKID